MMLLFLSLAMPVAAEVVTTEHTYTQDGLKFEGTVAFPEDVERSRPGVLIVHQWKGVTDYERRRARQLAELGYVAFTADIYGADTRPKTNHEAALASKTFRKDRNLYRRRVRAALAELRSFDEVRNNDVAAIGYCFGGTGVLELARSGANVDAVVSFHGGLSNPDPEENDRIRATVQVHHGAEDPHVPQESVNDFWNEMNQSQTDWELHVYSDAVHSFTEKEAGNDPSTGNAYNLRADRLSWDAMKRLFREEFS
jgi:dienelactone hydrolase